MTPTYTRIVSDELSILAPLADYIFIMGDIVHARPIEQQHHPPLTKGTYFVEGSTTHVAGFYQSLLGHVPSKDTVLVLTGMPGLTDTPQVLECVANAIGFIESGHPFDVLDLDGLMTWTAVTSTTTGAYRLTCGGWCSRASLYSASGKKIIRRMPPTVRVGHAGWIASFFEYYVIRPSLVPTMGWCASMSLDPLAKQWFLIGYLASLPRRQKPVLAKNNRFRWLLPIEWGPIDVFMHLPEIMHYIGPCSIRNLGGFFPTASSWWQKIFEESDVFPGTQTIELVRTIVENEPDVLYVQRHNVSPVKQYIMDLLTDVNKKTTEWYPVVLQLMGAIIRHHPDSVIVSSIIEKPFALDTKALRHFRFGKSPQFYQSLASKLWETNQKQIFYLVNCLTA